MNEIFKDQKWRDELKTKIDDGTLDVHIDLNKIYE